MKIKEYDYGNGTLLGVIDTKKFKNSCFHLTFFLPMTEYNASASKVLAGIMCRATAKRKTGKEVTRHLCQLYDASLGVENIAISGMLAMRITLHTIDDVYTIEKDGTLFSSLIDFVREMLFDPLVTDGELDHEYTRSEKKHASDAIKARINNKDAYALRRAAINAFKGTAYAIEPTGELDEVEALTPKELYDFFVQTVNTRRVLAVFAGDLTPERKLAMDGLMNELSERRRVNGLCDVSPCPAPVYPSEAEYVTERMAITQGKMVLNYSVPENKGNSAPFIVFDEIFGASPVSRLFTNVRERLSLCYYCSSRYSRNTASVVIRSGLDEDSKEKAMAEIERQITLLSDPNEISDEEMENAKVGILSSYASLQDGLGTYAGWYTAARASGFECDIDVLKQRVLAVTKEQVAEVAKGMRLTTSYFLGANEEK